MRALSSGVVATEPGFWPNPSHLACAQMIQHTGIRPRLSMTQLSRPTSGVHLSHMSHQNRWVWTPVTYHRSETQASRNKTIPQELDSASNGHPTQVLGTKGTQSKRRVITACYLGCQPGWNPGIFSETRMMAKH